MSGRSSSAYQCQKEIVSIAKLLLCLCLVLCPLQNLQAANIEDVQSLEQSGNYQEAFLKMIEIRKRRPTPQLIWQMAELLEKMQDYSMAIFYYQDLVTTYPGSEYEEAAKRKLSEYFEFYKGKDVYRFREKVEHHIDEGLEAMFDEDYHRAILHLKMARQLRKNHYITNFNLGYSYYELYRDFPKAGTYEELAVKYYNDAARSVSSPKVLNNLACIYAQRGDDILAHLFFKKAIDSATEPIELPGIKDLIIENMDYFASQGGEQGLTLLKELLP